MAQRNAKKHSELREEREKGREGKMKWGIIRKVLQHPCTVLNFDISFWRAPFGEVMIFTRGGGGYLEAELW
jgi:hypothetical protein